MRREGDRILCGTRLGKGTNDSNENYGESYQISVSLYSKDSLPAAPVQNRK